MASHRTVQRKRDERDEGVEGSLRRCIVSGDSRAPERMVRFVVGPDGDIVPDVAHKLPGRGYWVGAERALIQRAVEREAFSKAARTKVVHPADLAFRVEALIVARLGELLGLARRAGVLTLGFAKVEPLLKSQAGRIAALVEASNSGGADRGKLIGIARRNPGIRVVGCLTDEEIGVALGRENVIHACLSHGPLADRFLSEAERLGGFRVLCPAEWDVASHREGDGV
ncbi:MAG: RNA-binding protein [Alphaproteobacteria bacterium]